MWLCCCATDDKEVAYCFDPYYAESYGDKGRVIHADECFRVLLPDSAPLGLSLDCLDGLTALVNHVRSAGTIDAYNRAAQTSGRFHEQVRPGDYIVEVNGTRESAKMVEMMERGGSLNMKVVRPWQFLVSMNDREESYWQARTQSSFVDEPQMEPASSTKRTEAGWWARLAGPACSMTVWGVHFSWAASGKTLMVEKVGPGPILDWNTKHPDRAVLRFDRVVAVNGIRATNSVDNMLEQLQQNRSSELMISRPVFRNELIQPSMLSFFMGASSEDDRSQAKGLRKVVELWGDTNPTQKIEVCGLSSHEVEGHPTETDLLSRAAGRAVSNRSVSTASNNRGPIAVGRKLNNSTGRSEETISDITSHAGSVMSVESTLPKIGEILYFTAGRQRLENGDKLLFGQKGRVVSLVARKTKTPAANRQPGPEYVEMMMEGNRNAVCIRKNELSREVPAMPPGWAVGDRVHYKGPERSVSTTDTLTPGLGGEVVGRAARRGDGKDDNRLSVHFDGHRLNTPIVASAIRRQQ